MTIQNTTVYGSGLIGCGWAVCFLRGGCQVTVYDVDEERLEFAHQRIQRLLAWFAQPEIGMMTEEQVQACLDRLHLTCDVKTGVENAQFIQEAGPENLAIKHSMIAAIEEFNTSAIIASSTAGLLVTDIAAQARYPERIIAGHPFLPVQLMPLVEVAGGESTAPETLEQARAFYCSVGKEPVVLLRECKGFLANSLQNVVQAEALRLISQGYCSVEDLDRAMTFGPGLRWGILGPCLLLELAGGQGGIDRRIQRFDNRDGWLDAEKVCAGTKAELAARPAEKGCTHEGLEEYRNRALAAIVKVLEEL